MNADSPSEFNIFFFFFVNNFRRYILTPKTKNKKKFIFKSFIRTNFIIKNAWTQTKKTIHRIGVFKLCTWNVGIYYSLPRKSYVLCLCCIVSVSFEPLSSFSVTNCVQNLKTLLSNLKRIHQEECIPLTRSENLMLTRNIYFVGSLQLPSESCKRDETYKWKRTYAWL